MTSSLVTVVTMMSGMMSLLFCPLSLLLLSLDIETTICRSLSVLYLIADDKTGDKAILCTIIK